MTQRVLDLATSRGAGGPAPVPFCWLAFGSEAARQEQGLRTDQDNGLAYEDPSPADAAAVATYFARLAARSTGRWSGSAFRSARGGSWHRTRVVPAGRRWARRFRDWMQDSGPEEVWRPASFSTCARPGARRPGRRGFGELDPDRGPGALAPPGTPRPGRRRAAGPAHGVRDIRPARAEPHRGTVDIKGGGVLQLTGAGRARPRAGSRGDQQARTASDAATTQGVYEADEGREIVDAYQLLQRLRLAHQLGRLERDEPPDNRLTSSACPTPTSLLLRDALRTVTRVQESLRVRYATDLLE